MRTSMVIEAVTGKCLHTRDRIDQLESPYLFDRGQLTTPNDLESVSVRTRKGNTTMMVKHSNSMAVNHCKEFE